METIFEGAAFAGFLVAQFLAVVVTHAARFDDVAKESRHTTTQTGGLREKRKCGPHHVFEEEDLANQDLDRLADGLATSAIPRRTKAKNEARSIGCNDWDARCRYLDLGVLGKSH